VHDELFDTHLMMSEALTVAMHAVMMPNTALSAFGEPGSLTEQTIATALARWERVHTAASRLPTSVRWKCQVSYGWTRCWMDPSQRRTILHHHASSSTCVLLGTGGALGGDRRLRAFN
jgi:hypothetical protein